MKRIDSATDAVWDFGEDSAGELYVIKVDTGSQNSVGTVYRIEAE